MREIRILVLVALAGALGGCYCWQAAHQSEAKCIVAHQAVDCTTQNVNVLEPAALALITDLIGGTSIDWNAIAQRLEAFGFTDAGCLLAQLQNDFLQSGAAAKPEMQDRIGHIQTALAALKRRHQGDAVRFRVKRVDGTVVEL
jgi:hypothetical protein